MKAFITGGAGFIGSNIAKYFLNRGWEVVLFDNLSTGYRENIPDDARVTFVEGDVLDAAAVAKAVRGSDAVLHLAASVGNLRSIENPQKDSQINVQGTLNVLAAARSQQIPKFVYSSSAGIFGELKKLPIDEEHPLAPDSFYGVSKLAGELHALCYAKLYGMDVVCLRYFNVYGPNQRYDAYGNVIPIFATRKLKNEPLTIYGDGSQTRDFVHVEDVAQANFLAAATKNATGAYNIGSGTAITINQLAQWMDEIAGTGKPHQYEAPRKGEVRDSLADIRKAQKILGFKPVREMKAGLKGYWEWVRR